MLVELLRVSGGEGAELLRRWVAALLTAPADERRSIVEAVEKRIAQVYDPSNRPALGADPLLHIENEPTKRNGFVEVVVKSYSANGKRPTGTPAQRKRRA